MPFIKVSPSVLASMGSTLQSAATKVTGISDNFASIARYLDWDVKAQGDIQRRISSITNSLADYKTKLQNMYHFALQAQTKYSELDSADSSSSQSGGGGGSGVTKSKWETFLEEFGKEYTLDDALKGSNYIIKIKNLIEGFTGAESWKDVYKNVKDVNKFISEAKKTYNNYKKIGNAVSGKTAAKWWLKNITGLKPLGRASSAKNIFARFKGNLCNKTSPFNKQLKETIGDFTGKNGVGKAVAKWGGVVLDGVMNWFSNKEEQAASGGKMSDGRVVAETITETVVGTVLTNTASIVVGAAVTTVLGTAAAPAIVVTALTGLVMAGANAGIKALTGKSATEFISDGILDAGVAIGKGAKKAAKAVGNWFKKIF